MYTHNILFLYWSFYHYIVSFFTAFVLVWYECVTLLSCHFPLLRYPFSIPSLSVCVSFALKWTSCRQHIVDSCFIIQSATVCLLIGAFNPLTFKVIIDKYIVYCHFNLVFQLILYFFCSFFFPFVVWCYVCWFFLCLCSSWCLWIDYMFFICGYAVFQAC